MSPAADPPRILIVDDEENLRFVIETGLQQSGYIVESVATGREALKAVEEQPPDLLVLDVMLPDLDGFEVCRRLRAERKDVGIIFLTARSNREERVRGLMLGADDYLTKPFGIDELLARVAAVLRRVGRGLQKNTLECADLELDDDGHTVTRAGEPITLSPTEYRLLRFLLLNQGRVMSRNQILDHVWDYDFVGESTVVETFMSSLRRKLNRFGPPLIHTVRGVGYRLGAS